MSKARCEGRTEDHCCFIDGEACRYLDRVDGQWRCSLRRMLESWDMVHESPGYRQHVKPTMDRIGVQCGDYPPPGKRCAVCGVTG